MLKTNSQNVPPALRHNFQKIKKKRQTIEARTISPHRRKNGEKEWKKNRKYYSMAPPSPPWLRDNTMGNWLKLPQGENKDKRHSTPLTKTITQVRVPNFTIFYKIT